MSHLDKKTIQHLTKLCRIDCSEEEQEALLRDLENILNFVDQLQEINTEEIPPSDHVLEEIFNVMREDNVGQPMPREIFLSIAPSHVGGMIRVPPVFKQNP
jgi:aspartyl-tRNA(Asn)/glutamyl-tRNA(Gln) amidotransferase subunit C